MRPCMFWILVSLFALIAFEIVLYNKNVSARHAITVTHEELRALQSANADLKNQLFALLDFKNADMLAANLGLVKDSRPHYFIARTHEE